MSIHNVVEHITKQADDWYQNLEESKQLLYADAYAHCREMIVEFEYDDYDTVENISMRLNIFISKSSHFPDQAKDSRMSIASSFKSIIDNVKTNSLSIEIDKVNKAVENFLKSQPKEKRSEFEPVTKKLNKILSFIGKLNQRNLNLPDMLISQFKKSSQSMKKEERMLFDQVYDVANSVLERNQLKGQSKQLVEARTKCVDSIPSNRTPSFELGYYEGLREIDSYKGNMLGAFIKMKEKDIENYLLDNPNSAEIKETMQGKKEAILSFAKFYTPPKKTKILERDSTAYSM